MPRRRQRPAKVRTVSAKEISVLAWIQDAYGNVLLVQQTAGRQLWSLPGGKVRTREALEKALRREIKEEIGLTVKTSAIIDLFDRPKRRALAILYRVTLRRGRLRFDNREIQDTAFVSMLPARATPSARHFWRRQFPGAAGRTKAR